jgi:transcriptional regulator with XRE-family HTH domain
MDDFLRQHRRTVRDYRLALGLAITQKRESAEISLAELASRTQIPEQTLRSYEHGEYQPQVGRLLALSGVLDQPFFQLLYGAAEYVYRASGRPLAAYGTDTAKACSLLLYCGATPDEASTIVERGGNNG